MTCTIRNAAVRGITFLPQQFSGYVPAGQYAVIREGDLQYSDLGQARTGRAVEIVNSDTGATWFIGLPAAAKLGLTVSAALA